MTIPLALSNAAFATSGSSLGGVYDAVVLLLIGG
jgi:hypothetical protein